MKNAIRLLLTIATIMPIYVSGTSCNPDVSNNERNESIAEFRRLNFEESKNIDLQEYAGASHAIVISLLSELLLHKANIIDGTNFGSVKRHDLKIALELMFGLESSIIAGNDINFRDEKPISFIAPSIILPENAILYGKLLEISQKYNGFLPQDEIDNLFKQNEIQQLVHDEKMRAYLPTNILEGDIVWFEKHFLDPGTLIKVGQNAPMQVIEPVVVIDNEELYKKLHGLAEKYDGILPADLLLNKKENLLKEMVGDNWENFFKNKKLLSKTEWNTHINTSAQENLKDYEPSLYLNLLEREEVYPEHSFWTVNPFNIQYKNHENIHVVPMTIDLSIYEDFMKSVCQMLFGKENAVPPAKVDFFEFYRASVTTAFYFDSDIMREHQEDIELESRFHELKVSQLVRFKDHEFQLARHCEALPKNIPSKITSILFPLSRVISRHPAMNPIQATYVVLPKYLSTENDPLYDEFAEITYGTLSKFEDIFENRLRGSKIDARYKGISTNMLTDVPKEQQSMIQPTLKKGTLGNNTTSLLGVEGRKIIRANYIKLCDSFSTILRVVD